MFFLFSIATYDDYLWRKENVSLVDDNLIDFIINIENNIEKQIDECLNEHNLKKCIGDFMGIFIYSFTASGKTSVAKKYNNVIDMESTLYKYLGSKNEDETKKGTKRDINGQWPNNYFKTLKEVEKKYDYILISDEICDEFLKENNFEFWCVYPNKNLKEEYLERCKKRGNNNDFIEWYAKVWDEWIVKYKNNKLATKHIELKSNQYLEDVLPNLK